VDARRSPAEPPDRENTLATTIVNVNVRAEECW
jgi:hypothetical protein